MKGQSVAAAILLVVCLALGLLAGQARLAGAPAASQPAAAGGGEATTQKAAGNYSVTRSVQVPGEGGWDPWSFTPVTLDDQGKLLYVSRGARTQAIEVATGKVVAEIGVGAGGTAGGIALVPDAGRGFITNSHDHTVIVFDLKTHQVLGNVLLKDVPESIVYDAKSKQVLVGCAPGALVPIAAAIDLKTGKPGEPIELDGSPLGMVSDGQGMVYACIYDQDEVSVVDTRTMRVAATWPVDDWARPNGIAIDTLRNRLFVGCRSTVVVLSCVDGHSLGQVKVGGPDSWVAKGCVAFHEGKVFTSCGDGILTVVGQSAAGAFKVEKRMEIPKAVYSIALDPRTETFYFPASDASKGPERRWGSGIKLVTLAKK